MSGFFVLDVPGFRPLLGAASRSDRRRTHPARGGSHYVEFDAEVEIRRADTGMNEAVWFGCMTAGIDGRVARFDGERLRPVATNEPVLGPAPVIDQS